MGEIKNYLMAILKESLKFALLAIILFLFLGNIGCIIVYVLKTDETDAEILAIVAGFIIAIVIVVIDGKKLHYGDKIVSIHLKILNILKNKYFGEKKNDK